MAVEEEGVETAWWDGVLGYLGKCGFGAGFGGEGDGRGVVGVECFGVAEDPGEVEHGGLDERLEVFVFWESEEAEEELIT